MSQFFGRFLKSMVEDHLVEKLSNSKTFQKVAVSVVQTTEAAQKAVSDPEARLQATQTAASFFSALKAEIAKDMGAGGKDGATAKPRAVDAGGASSSSKSSR